MQKCWGCLLGYQLGQQTSDKTILAYHNVSDLACNLVKLAIQQTHYMKDMPSKSVAWGVSEHRRISGPRSPLACGRDGGVMTRVQHFIEPLDVLYLRGNKLFGAPGSYGEIVVPALAVRCSRGVTLRTACP